MTYPIVGCARVTPSPFEGEGWDGGWATTFGTHGQIERRTPTPQLSLGQALTLPLTGGGNLYCPVRSFIVRLAGFGHYG